MIDRSEILAAATRLALTDLETRLQASYREITARARAKLSLHSGGTVKELFRALVGQLEQTATTLTAANVQAGEHEPDQIANKVRSALEPIANACIGKWKQALRIGEPAFDGIIPQVHQFFASLQDRVTVQLARRPNSEHERTISDMAADADVRRALNIVRHRFLNLQQPTKRSRIHEELRGKGQYIERLLLYEFLRQPVNDFMVPGFLAFEHADHQSDRDLAKAGTEIVLSTLKNLYRDSYAKTPFPFDNLAARAKELFPNVLPEELRIGLLLAPELGKFVSSREWNNEVSSLKSIAVQDEILDFTSIDHAWQEKLDTLLARAAPGKQPEADSTSPTMNRKKIFVIYGRNERLRRAMFDYLRSLGLEPMEWTQLLANTGKGSPYTGEVIEQGFREAAGVVALLTPDDYAHLHPDLLKEKDKEYERVPTPQARPNVLFELGMAFAHHPDRTIVVEIGELRPFSDVAGRQTIKFDGTPPKRQELRNQLRTAGCQIDEHGTDYLHAGNFSLRADRKARRKRSTTNSDDTKQRSILGQDMEFVPDPGYYLKKSEQAAGKHLPYCPLCWKADKKDIPLNPTSGAGYYRCDIHNSSYQEPRFRRLKSAAITDFDPYKN